MDDNKLKQLARSVIEIEAAGVLALGGRIDEAFVRACRIMLECKGRIVVLGMGKSGHIGGKIAATLASTGSPSFFVHPAEASHGDLGMITKHDVVLALSNSGNTAEILTLLPIIKRLAIPLITLTGKADSKLAQAATVHIDVSVEREACPLGLAPTSSSTAALAMGDALAIAMLEDRGFNADDFARSHPGGKLGRRLLVLVDDVMHSGTDIPRNQASDNISEALIEMSRQGLGMTIIADEDDAVLGVFTDGDLRRTMDQRADVHNEKVGKVMTANCRSARTGMLAAEALQLMEEFRINSMPVIDENQRLVGALNVHDMLRAGVL